MEVLGRKLPVPFDEFWERYVTEIPVSIEHIEAGHSVVFGDQGADLSAPNLPAWAELPGDDLAYHVAHELFHIVQRQRGYPKTVRGRQYPPNSVEGAHWSRSRRNDTASTAGGIAGGNGLQE